MGGGNGNKAHMKRERNAKKLQDQKKGSGENQKVAAQRAMTLVCQICRTQFMQTSNLATLKSHTDSKHPKESFEKCFPGFPTDEDDE